MIAVAADHVRNVRHRPLLENFGVAELARARRHSQPATHLFFAGVNSSNASSITRKPSRSHRFNNSGSGGLWLVRMALTPISFSTRKRRSRTLVRHGRANRTGIVMQANALELGRNAIEKKSLIRVKHRGADAKWRFRFVHGPVAGLEAAFQGVKLRRCERP